MDSVGGIAAADLRGSAVVSVVKSVRQSKFTENAAIRCRRKRLVREGGRWMKQASRYRARRWLM